MHLIDADYDTGPVIAAQTVPVMPGDDVAALRARVQIAERELLLATLNTWARPTSEPSQPTIVHWHTGHGAPRVRSDAPAGSSRSRTRRCCATAAR